MAIVPCLDTTFPLLRSFNSGSGSILSNAIFCMSSFIEAKSLSPVSCATRKKYSLVIDYQGKN